MIAAFSLVSSNAFSQQESEDLSTTDLEAEDPAAADFETVVVANRFPNDPFTLGRSSNVVDQKELIELAPRTTPEALTRETGVFVQQTNHGGGSPIIRGMIGPQNLILIDGVRLNNSVFRTGPTQYLNLIDPLSMERIEVLRGPGSLMYGSDAMGGVIQGITLSPEPTTSTEKNLKAGALGRYASANRGQTINGYVGGSVHGTQALGGFTFKRFDDLVGGRTVGVQPFSGYDSWSALGHLGHVFTDGPLDGVSIKAVYISTRIYDAGRTDKLWDSQKLQVYDNADDLTYARISADMKKIKSQASLTVSYQHFDESKDNISMADDLRTRLDVKRDMTTVHTVGTDLKVDTRLLDSRLNFQAGGMFYRDFVDAASMSYDADNGWTNLSSSAYPSGSTYDVFGAYLMGEADVISSLGGHILRLNGGYRFHGMAGNAPAMGDLEAVHVDSKGNVFCAGIQYLYRRAATVAFSFSEGFRAPNLAEAAMLGDTGKYFHIPNDNLKPESSDTLELLTRFKAGPLIFGVTGYVSFIEDLITREETTWQGDTEIEGKPVVWNVNTKEGLLLGVESSVKINLGAGFSMAGNVTYTWGEQSSDGGETVPMTRIPPLFGLAELRYDTQTSSELRWFASTDLLATLEQARLSPEDENDVRIPEGGTPAWTSWNVGFGAFIGDHLQMIVRLENLLNDKYKMHGSGLYAPGTNAVLTMKAQF